MTANAAGAGGDPSPVRGGVSVVIPTFRERDFIRGTIASVLRNIRPGDEVLIVANGSTPDLASLAELAHGPVSLVSLPDPGLAHARNTGLRRSQHEYVVLCDDDDELVDGGIEALRQHLDASPQTLVVAGEVIEFGNVPTYQQRRFRDGPRLLGMASLLGASIPSPGAGMFRRKALLAAGGFEPHLVPCDDAEVWVKMAAMGIVAGIANPTLRYRIHDQGISRGAYLMARQGRRIVLQYRGRLATPLERYAATLRLHEFYVPQLERTVRMEWLEGDYRRVGRTVVLLSQYHLMALRCRVITKLRKLSPGGAGVMPVGYDGEPLS